MRSNVTSYDTPFQSPSSFWLFPALGHCGGLQDIVDGFELWMSLSRGGGVCLPFCGILEDGSSMLVVVAFSV